MLSSIDKNNKFHANWDRWKQWDKQSALIDLSPPSWCPGVWMRSPTESQWLESPSPAWKHDILRASSWQEIQRKGSYLIAEIIYLLYSINSYFFCDPVNKWPNFSQWSWQVTMSYNIRFSGLSPLLYYMLKSLEVLPSVYPWRQSDVLLYKAWALMIRTTFHNKQIYWSFHWIFSTSKGDKNIN